MPLPPGTISRQSLTCNKISSRVFLPAITSARCALGLTPRITSTLAMPRSASSKMVFLPRLDRASARFTVMLVLPTPPLPLVTTITRASEWLGIRGLAATRGTTGVAVCWLISSRRRLAWSLIA